MWQSADVPDPLQCVRPTETGLQLHAARLGRKGQTVVPLVRVCDAPGSHVAVFAMPRWKPIARLLLGAALAALVAGCTIPVTPNYPKPAPAPAPLPPQPSPPRTPQPSPPVVTPSPTPAPPPTPRPAPSVTLALVQQSESARASGDYDKAVALLERAIRIEPDRPELWIELATCHLQQGDYDAAEQFARKALQFTGTQYQLEQRAWGVIGAAQAARREDRRL